MTDTELILRLRARAARAIEDIDSPNPVKALAARLEIACIASDKFEPMANGRWKKLPSDPGRGAKGGRA